MAFKRNILTALAFGLCVFAPALSYACGGASPTGVEGDVMFNETSGVPQYCDGANWIAMTGGELNLNAPQGCPNIGDVCDDGSVFAGLSPDGNIPMYTTPVDAPSGLPWNNGNSSNVVNLYTPITESDTGGANSSAAFIGIDSDSGTSGVQPFQAPEYCHALNSHGRNDWYVPATDEWTVLYTNRNDIGGFLGTNYWTSTEVCCDAMVYRSLTDGSTGSGIKRFGNRVRCVRKQPSDTALYVPNGVNFDGGDELYEVLPASGVVDSTQATGSFWIRSNNIDSGGIFESYIAVTPGFRFSFTTDFTFRVRGLNSSGSQVLNMRTSTSAVNYSDGQWHHVVFSFDNAAGNHHIYINGVDALDFSNAPSPDAIDFFTSTQDFDFGFNLEADLADFWLDFGTYIDLSDANNRALFYSAGPVDLGTNGQLPTGTSPEFFFSGDAASWNTNRGTAGGLAYFSGALTNSTENPGGTTEQTQIVPSGLIGHWRMDETSGTSVSDTSGNGFDINMQNGMSAASNSTAGAVGNAFSFDAASDHHITDAAAEPFSTQPLGITLSAWINPTSWGEGGEGCVFSLTDGDDDFQVRLVNDAGQEALRVFIRSGKDANSANNTISLGEWQHIVAMFPGVGIDPRLYINGQEVAYASQNDNATNAGASIGSNVMIGGCSDGTVRNFDGLIDDVRLYNRALVDSEIALLAEARDGIRYNTSQRTMEYFDGNKFVSMTPEWAEPTRTIDGYTPNAVVFDGTNDWLENESLSESPPTLISGSFWIKRDSASIGTSDVILHNADSNGYFRIRFNTSNLLVFDGRDESGGAFTTLMDTNNTLSADQWYHVLFSLDTTNRSLDRLYVNGVDDTDSTSSTMTAFGGGDRIYVGAFGVTNLDKLDAELADFWIDFGNYIDFSLEANRRKFIDGAGNPVDLGSDGSLPTGSQPDIYLSGDTATWHTNDGALAGFTEQGALTDGNPIVDYGGLVGHWKLDEATGSATARDEVTGNEHAIQRSASETNTVSSTKGAVGNAYSLNGTVTIEATDDAQYALDESWSISVWAKSPDLAQDRFFVMRGTNPNRNYTMLLTSAGQLRVGYDNGSVFAGRQTTASYDDDEWHHFVGIFDDSTNALSVYVDGVLVPQSNTGAGVGSEPSSQPSSVLRVLANAGYISFVGTADDVRIYDRVLSLGEIQQLYQMGSQIGDNSALPLGCPNIGDVCDDGTIYVGLSPDGNAPMFAASEDASPNPLAWNNNNATGIVDVPGSSTDSGENNTNLLVVTDSDSVTAGFQTHIAAQRCFDYEEHGASDWYLPSEAELRLFLMAETTVPLGQNYWGSDQRTATTAEREQLQSSGSTAGGHNPKDNSIYVRCVRKGPAPRCANPYGIEGSIVYNTTHDVMQYCDGARWRAIGK